MMTRIVEQFGKRREPVVPTLTRPVPAPHENAAQALAFVSDLSNQVHHLREENGQLRADLNLSMLRNRDLERDMLQMRSDMEAYRRYSVEVKTHLQHIVDAATRANEAALEAGEKTDSQAETVIGNAERELRDMATGAIGQKYGANNAQDEHPSEPQHG